MRTPESVLNKWLVDELPSGRRLRFRLIAIHKNNFLMQEPHGQDELGRGELRIDSIMHKISEGQIKVMKKKDLIIDYVAIYMEGKNEPNKNS